ncbi:Cysteine-rich repeat secretory protein [Vigna angularis]|uniref:Cysteine-rich repeat secretory protein n=1 Tax=Phaseolus angularis TaxID=3914 RepID=A0A8T0JFV9_PHAAN|nr:Cysteine-rich repeat secretory protein [Vigna angularis]
MYENRETKTKAKEEGSARLCACVCCLYVLLDKGRGKVKGEGTASGVVCVWKNGETKKAKKNEMRWIFEMRKRENFTANSPYESNLKTLINSLIYKTPSSGFGVASIDYTNRFYMWNLNNVSDPSSFNYKTRELLSQLAEKAYVTSNFYATGEVYLENSVTLYGLTQCTRDLSSNDCKKCLDDAIDELPNCCDGKEGGRVVSGSCNFRYEIYPFVKE